jgi:hypothetical protein
MQVDCVFENCNYCGTLACRSDPFLKTNYFSTGLLKTQGLTVFKTLFPQIYEFQNRFPKLAYFTPWSPFKISFFHNPCLTIVGTLVACMLKNEQWLFSTKREWFLLTSRRNVWPLSIGAPMRDELCLGMKPILASLVGPSFRLERIPRIGQPVCLGWENKKNLSHGTVGAYLL